MSIEKLSVRDQLLGLHVFHVTTPECQTSHVCLFLTHDSGINEMARIHVKPEVGCKSHSHSYRVS
jgi:hypothetical protein